MKIILLPSLIISLALTSFVIKETASCTTESNTPENTNENQPVPDQKFSPESGATGLYVISDYHKNLDDKVISSPLIDGVFQRSYWKTFEPQEGKYDWTFMDDIFDKAIKYNKKVSLGIAAGNGQPDWIYEKDIPFMHFVELPKEGKGKFVADVKLPVFWNQKYIAYWTSFVAAVANHLKSKPEYWNALSMIKVTGFNRWNSDEFRLPAQRDIKNDKAKSTDAIKIWKENGYRPSLVINAFKQVVDTFGKYFPDKQLCLPIITGGKGFPSIGEDSRESGDQKGETVTEIITNHMTSKFGKQFMSMYEALQDNPKNNSVSFLVVEQYNKGASIGYQLCQACYKFPPCLKDNTPCDNDTFYKVFENGMSKGSLYFEMYPDNIKAYPEALKKAQEKIKRMAKKI